MDDVLGHVVGDSTPGIPWMKLGQKNKDVLENHTQLIKDAVVESFIRSVVAGESIFSQSPDELIRNGLRDPVRLFIKNEPHGLKKIQSGKYRLISGVSLRDQLKERILGSLQNNAEIESWTTCPSRPGVGLNDEGLLIMGENFKEELKEGGIMETDVSGWDWSVQNWEIKADVECRRRLAQASEDSLYAFLLRVQAYTIASTVYTVPGGEMIRQGVLGIQKSGSYWTSSTNSRMRVLASLVARQMAGIKLTKKVGVSAMGDDSTERHFDGAKLCLERLGHKVKFVKTNFKLAGISFCSHEWLESGLAIPETAPKTVFRYLSHPKVADGYPEWFAQLDWTLRHHPDRNRLLRVCRARVDSMHNSMSSPNQISCQ